MLRFFYICAAVFFFAISAFPEATFNFAEEKWENVPPIDDGDNTIINITPSELSARISSGLSDNTTYVISAGEEFVSNTSVGTITNCENVIIRGATGNPDDVLFQGYAFGMTCPSSGKVSPFIGFGSGAKNITIADLSFAGFYQNGLKFNGGSGCENIIIHHVNGTNCGERHVKGTTGGFTGGEVRYCKFVNTAVHTSPYSCAGSSVEETGDYVTAVDIMGLQDFSFHHNYFKDLKGGSSSHDGRGAIFLWHGCDNIRIENNIFLNNDRSLALGNWSASDYSVRGALVANNFIVAGLGRNTIEFIATENIKVYNNTIYGSDTSDIFFRHSPSNIEIKNCIFAEQFEYNNASGFTPQTSNNVRSVQSSWFVNTGTGDLHLSGYNPSIVDQGISLSEISTDIDNLARTGTLDIGADEYNNEDAIEDMPISRDERAPITASPNPFNPSVKINLNGLSGAASIKALDAAGRRVETIASAITLNGDYVFRWDASSRPGGVYVISVDCAGKNYSKKIVLSK